jgi:hypothetical protein
VGGGKLIGFIQAVLQQLTGLVLVQARAQHKDDLLVPGRRVCVAADRHKRNDGQVDGSHCRQYPEYDPACAVAEPRVERTAEHRISDNAGGQQPDHEIAHVEVGQNHQRDRVNNERRRQQIQQKQPHVTF